jgi:hypothetical protein
LLQHNSLNCLDCSPLPQLQLNKKGNSNNTILFLENPVFFKYCLVTNFTSIIWNFQRRLSFLTVQRVGHTMIIVNPIGPRFVENLLHMLYKPVPRLTYFKCKSITIFKKKWKVLHASVNFWRPLENFGLRFLFLNLVAEL